MAYGDLVITEVDWVTRTITMDSLPDEHPLDNPDTPLHFIHSGQPSVGLIQPEFAPVDRVVWVHIPSPVVGDYPGPYTSHVGGDSPTHDPLEPA